MQWAAEATAHNNGTVLTLALNYGARSELVDAFQSLAREAAAKNLPLEHICEEDLAATFTPRICLIPIW